MSLLDVFHFLTEFYSIRYEKIVLKKWYTVFKDNVTLYDYEINDGCSLELYYA